MVGYYASETPGTMTRHLAPNFLGSIVRSMSNDPNQPIPYARVAIPVPPRRPTAVTVLAIIAIVLYSLLLLCSPLTLLPPESDDPVDTAFSGTGAMRVYNVITGLLYMVIAVFCIVSASYCLLLRPWARRTLVRGAIADLVLSTIGIVIFFALTVPEVLNSATDPSSRSMVVAILAVTSAIILVMPALPICIVYFMTRPKIVAAFDHPRTPAAASGYDTSDV